MKIWWMALLVFVLPTSAGQARGFSRVEQATRRCRIERGDIKRSCNRLQISDTGSDGLRIRFTGPGETPGSSHQLSFVALAREQPSPLRCEKGNCQLSGRRWTADIISIAWVEFDKRGLPRGLPTARTVRGTCRINDRLINCESHRGQLIDVSAEAQI